MKKTFASQQEYHLSLAESKKAQRLGKKVGG